MFNDQLLSEYADTFLGYGNQNGKFCFIGLEEGIGGSFEDCFKEVNSKITSWEKRGKKQLEDCRDFHLSLPFTKWHINPTKEQPTWRGIIRIILSYEEIPLKLNNTLSFQSERLGRLNDNHCMIELRPLPGKNMSSWFYNKYSKIDYLKFRTTYTKHITPKRINLLREFINKNNFKHIIFFSSDSKTIKLWEQIADEEFKDVGQNFLISDSGKYIRTEHPANFQFSKKKLIGTKDFLDIFEKIGNRLRNLG